MLKNYILTIICAIFFVAACWHFASNLPYSGMSTAGKSDKFELYPNLPLIQKFSADQDNFSRIKFQLSGPDLDSGDKIKMQLTDETCQNVIKEDEIQTSKLSSENYDYFDFSKIKDSRDRIFCFSLIYEPINESTTKTPDVAARRDINAIFISLNDMRTGKEYNSKHLNMKLAYKNDHWWQDAENLTERISQYKPFFLKKCYLASVILAFLILSFATVIILINLKIPEE